MSILSTYTTENYLKAIVKILATPNKERITTGELAKLLQVTSGTATTMIKKLEREGYVKYTSYQGCSLTQKGSEYGLRVLRRHRLLETFLIDVLELSWDEAHEEAEKLEHSISDNLTEKIAIYLKHPTKNYSGNIIPAKEQLSYQINDSPLREAPLNKKLIISRIEGNSEMASYFKEEQLLPGNEVTLLELNIEIGLAKLKVKNKVKTISLLALNNLFYEN